MNRNLLDDEARCNNHRCKLRNDCVRYLQLTVDFHAHGRKNSFWITRFPGKKQDEFGFVTECDNQIRQNEDLRK